LKITLHWFNAVPAATLALLFAGLYLAPQDASAQVIDRIVATVNGHVILQSDWEEALSYEALLSNRNLKQFSADDRRAVLDRLIDQELLREQMKSADFRHATDVEVAARVAQARKLYPQAASDEAWRDLLAHYRLTQKDLQEHVRQQIDVIRLIDARLRPTVRIDSKSIEAYYRDQFVPQLRQAGASDVPLAEVAAKIQELLTQEKVSELLVSWLQTLRSEGQVHAPGLVPSSKDAGVQSQ
jgi:peptidyl-prolyl cis-trans isomerase SurA